MRKARLLSTVAATLLLTAGIASAQTMNKDEAAPNSAPAAQQKAPAEKVAPAVEARRAESQHEKGPGDDRPGAEGVRRRQDEAPPTRAAMDKDPAKSRPTRGSSDANGGANMKPKATRKRRLRPVQLEVEPIHDQREARHDRSGRSRGAAKLSTEQRSKIITIVRQHKVEPAHLNVSVSVGTRVPESVHFYPLPVEVIAIYPEWRGYDYILVGSEILVIDPRTHEIVAILEA